MNKNEIIGNILSEKETNEANNGSSIHNKLSEIRKKIAKRLDKKLGTNLANKKLPKPMKEIESNLAKLLNKTRDI